MQQLTVFDIYPDSYCGKMSQERSVQTAEKISAPSSKKPRGSQTRLPMFLDLTESGATAEASWGTGIPYRGICTTLNGGESLRDASGCVWYAISTDSQHPKFYLVLNLGEKPREPVPSRLTDILETNPDPKYQLSAKACLGILRRAERRGKELPKELKEALEQQATRSKSGGALT